MHCVVDLEERVRGHVSVLLLLKLVLTLLGPLVGLSLELDGQVGGVRQLLGDLLDFLNLLLELGDSGVSFSNLDRLLLGRLFSGV